METKHEVGGLKLTGLMQFTRPGGSADLGRGIDLCHKCARELVEAHLYEVLRVYDYLRGIKLPATLPFEGIGTVAAAPEGPPLSPTVEDIKKATGWDGDRPKYKEQPEEPLIEGHFFNGGPERP